MEIPRDVSQFVPISIEGDISSWLSAWGSVLYALIKTGDPTAAPTMEGLPGTLRGGYCLSDAILKHADVERYFRSLSFWASPTLCGPSESNALSRMAGSLYRDCVTIWCYKSADRLEPWRANFITHNVRDLLAEKLNIGNERPIQIPVKIIDTIKKTA